MTFKQAFFRIYDRKITSGEISFSQTGIKKDDFTRLCTEEGFVFDDETLEKISVTMKLSEEEKKMLYETIEASHTQN
ncbi:hypothetical protein [Emergencia sp.]|uniref:hypothetical protein n=1 Tax=Emergencia sp. TaxID=1926557 RepID=UPI003AEF1C7C